MDAQPEFWNYEIFFGNKAFHFDYYFLEYNKKLNNNVK